MNLRISLVSASLILIAGTVAGQTVTAPNPSGTANTVPVFTGSATIGNSPITVSGSNVGIGTTSPNYLLQVNGEAFANGGFRVDSSSGDDVNGAPWYGIGKSNFNLWPGYPNAVQLAGYWGLIFKTGNGGPMVIRGDTGNVGIGTTSPGAKLELNGNMKFTSGSGASVTFADGTQQTTAWTGVLCGGDYAEAVETSGSKTAYEPGDVLVISTENNKDVQKSNRAYSTSVVGIYATKPGVVGKRESLSKVADDIPMAMVGIVPTKVTAENGSIHRGDLLVTSSRAGYAMKGTDRSRMLGAVIGKALGNLDAGTGVIQLVVTLQ